jgi:RimJ/RimL family protein N-acetyltransferase
MLAVSSAITLPSQALAAGAVELRPLNEADVLAFVDALKDPSIGGAAYHGKIPAEPEPARAYVAQNPTRMASGTAVLLAVWETGADRLSGQTMLFNVDWEELTAELGFWTAPWARGRRLSVAALG